MQIRDNFGERLCAFIIPTLFNKLPEHIFFETTFIKFKRLVYEWLARGEYA